MYYLTLEMDKTFVKGQQIWGSHGNMQTKQFLVEEAYRRAEIAFRLAVGEKHRKHQICNDGE